MTCLYTPYLSRETALACRDHMERVMKRPFEIREGRLAKPQMSLATYAVEPMLWCEPGAVLDHWFGSNYALARECQTAWRRATGQTLSIQFLQSRRYFSDSVQLGK